MDAESCFPISEVRLQNVVPLALADSCQKSGVWGRTTTLVSAGQAVLVDAASGCGKSSLVSFVYGERPDFSGTVLFNGTDVRHFPSALWTQVRLRHLSVVWQDLRLFLDLTVEENLRLKLDLTGHRQWRQVLSWLQRVGLEGKLRSSVRTLSLGQRQRVAVLRALCQPFDVLLADEPFAHLDEANRASLAQLVAEEVGSQGAALVVTTTGSRPPLAFDSVLSL